VHYKALRFREIVAVSSDICTELIKAKTIIFTVKEVTPILTTGLQDKKHLYE
jgi:hypothetical protein